MPPVAEAAQERTTFDRPHGNRKSTEGNVKDPVCGMTVAPPTKAGSVEHDGETFHFCSADCRAKFEADPDKCVAEASSDPVRPGDAGAVYTCPMHPEIEQIGPRQLPDLRNGARAQGRRRRGG